MSNMAKWENNKLTASEKRVLATWMYGQAWDRLCTQEYDAFRFEAFSKSGALVCVNDRNDEVAKVLDYGSLNIPSGGQLLLRDLFIERNSYKCEGLVTARPSHS
jgi:hypothetical protein